MLSKFFEGIFDSESQYVISITDFLMCVGCALLIGIVLAVVYTIRSKPTKSFLLTLCILPALVCVVIMLVNGNIGAGVAVAGAFSLVRFRSIAGTAKEIAVLFLAMTIGLITGMGYLGYALLFSVIICVILLLFQFIRIPENNKKMVDRTLRITIPEDLDYTNMFDDIFEEYATNCKLIQVRTTNMGSMFKLKYNLTIKDVSKEKEMIDALRVRNGNLEISISEQEVKTDEL